MRLSLYLELIFFHIISHALHLWLIIRIIHGLVGNISLQLQSPFIRVWTMLVEVHMLPSFDSELFLVTHITCTLAGPS